MSATDDAIADVLRELAEAKVWPKRLKQALDQGSDVSEDIRKAGEKVEALEKKARDTIKRLGCVDPQTREISQHMADMLINWYAFKDSLKW
jgi:hypothetical protein